MRELTNEELFAINDNQLLYLIREGSDEALELMFKKYQPLIISTANKLCKDRSMFDDYLQEGRVVLMRAIKRYQTNHQKTFNRFFSMLLVHQYISMNRSLIARNRRFVLMEEIAPEYQTESHNQLDIPWQQFSDLERKVYQLKYVRNLDNAIIAKELGYTIKQIYNTNERIKRKIKEYNLKE
ncbi:MAG TPA: sigma-70 family RNA polymerase sigma factor [Bacilli bacterium]|jgi:RNA polymerase sporulation-specific sigma factor|nr:sigma-70 family RNA polymerase sigma factor [Acholeplasmataceae bacterium]OQB62361.1 MAG: RNA polymerase sigma-H factor [Tenericutes bacterium ADurb.Bin140]HOE77494.1 sigma-70 family RNA polymerase sigma factor [Bacilli bacterium]HON64781.1 sigma-70 family RNA polymerase sigma factor [Bacilli bacterium]HOR95562.1 sigma-70 family RNA polymerase sigma factor [Bacilli bacterium]